MSTSHLTAQRLRDALSYNPDTGEFTNLYYRGANAKAGTVAGCPEAGYMRIKLDGVLHRAHRLAWLYMTGEWPAGEVDHIDGVRSNNKWANLRCTTKSQNLQNRKRAAKTSKTGILGVSPNGSGFQATIRINNVGHYLGTYKTVERAQAVYLEAKRALHTHSPV